MGFASLDPSYGCKRNLHLRILDSAIALTSFWPPVTPFSEC